jgi:hypothetical protein
MQRLWRKFHLQRKTTVSYVRIGVSGVYVGQWEVLSSRHLRGHCLNPGSNDHVFKTMGTEVLKI